MRWVPYKSDQFTRADAGTLGSDYPSGAADFSIVSNQAVLPSTGTDKYAMWASPAGDFSVDSTHYPDQYASALIYCSGSGTTGEGPGVHVRQKNDGTKEMYRLVADGAGHIELSRFNAGSYTMLAQYSATFVSGQRLTLRVTGQGTATVLETIYNGVSLGTYNDTSGSALNSGQPGISYSSEVTGTNKWDDVEFGFYIPDFPTTSVFEQFNRSDQNPIGSPGWTSPIHPSIAGLQIASNQLAPNASAIGGSWYSDASYGPDMEAFISLPVHPTVDTGILLYARTQNPGTTSLDGYIVSFTASSAGNNQWLNLVREDDGSDQTLNSIRLDVSGYTMDPGDKIGISCYGHHQQAYIYRGVDGFWTPLITSVDRTYPDAGYIGVVMDGGSFVRGDDLGGGTASLGVTPPLPERQTSYYSRRRSW